MPQNNPYQIYISSKCSCCNKLMNFINTKKIKITATNVDEEDYSLPFTIMMFPALVKKNKIISYGYDDIITKIK